MGAPRDADDQRPGSERRVDAFDRMLTQVLEAGLPSDKGIRPQLSVIVDTNGPSARLAGFGSIGPKLLDYLTCLSDLTPIVTTAGDLQAQILNVGRTRRHANRQQRRAIIARQGGECAAPGCHNTHLEIHHVTWWSRGGPTDLDQMIGLCVRCHHLVHRELLNIDRRRHTAASTSPPRHGRPLERASRPRDDLPPSRSGPTEPTNGSCYGRESRCGDVCNAPRCHSTPITTAATIDPSDPMVRSPSVSV